MRYLLIVLAFCVGLIFPVNITLAEAPDIVEPPRILSEKGLIVHYAGVYGANKEELLSVANCESSFNPNAVGDGGKAKNIFQYHQPTFIRFSALIGEELDYNSAHDQAKLTAYIWKNFPQYKSHWVCYTKLYKTA